jgi:hypothetical protein
MGSIELATIASTNSLRLGLPGIRNALSAWRRPGRRSVSVRLNDDGLPLEIDSSQVTPEQFAEIVQRLEESIGHSPGEPPIGGRPKSGEVQSTEISDTTPPPAPSPSGTPPLPPSSPPATSAPVGPRHSDDARAASDVGQALTVIATYVPAEALAAYVAITAILLPDNLGARAAAAVIALCLNLLFVMVGFRRSGGLDLVDQSAAEKQRSRWLTIAVTTWALSVYVASIPANVLTSFDWYKLQYGGVAAIVSALVLPLIARPQVGR